MFRSLRPDGADDVTLTLNGQQITVPAGQSVWSAIALAGQPITRRAALSGAPRSAYCAMGVCFECMMEINGVPNQQACLRQVEPGMTINTQIILEDSRITDAEL